VIPVWTGSARTEHLGTGAGLMQAKCHTYHITNSVKALKTRISCRWQTDNALCRKSPIFSYCTCI